MRYSRYLELILREKFRCWTVSTEGITQRTGTGATFRVKLWRLFAWCGNCRTLHEGDLIGEHIVCSCGTACSIEWLERGASITERDLREDPSGAVGRVIDQLSKPCPDEFRIKILPSLY